VPSVPWPLLVLLLAIAGCAEDGPATFTFAGQLDRSLTEEEQAEVRAVTGKAFTVESTDMFCPPEVDPYDCNDTWLRVDGITQGICRSSAEKLDARTYWRRPPSCRDLGNA
jgi:hypothetical protein